MSIEVGWRIPDAIEIATRLADRLRLPRPDVDALEAVFPLAGGTLRLVRTGPSEPAGLRLDAARDRPVADPGRPAADPGRVRLVGVGWATVDLDRGVAEIAARLGVDPRTFAPAADDRWLGARSRTAAPPGPPRRSTAIREPALVVLEPATEGRLAASLARHGEGSCVVWIATPGPVQGTVRDGPLGPAVLAVQVRPWGPFVLGVGGPGPGTIGG